VEDDLFRVRQAAIGRFANAGDGQGSGCSGRVARWGRFVPLHGPQPQIQGVDADEWNIPGVGQRFGDGQPDPQAGERARAIGHSHRGGPLERLAGHPIQVLQGGDQTDGRAGIGWCDGHRPHDLRGVGRRFPGPVNGRRAEFRQADRGLGIAAIDHQQEGRLRRHQFTGIPAKVIVHGSGRRHGDRYVSPERERTPPKGPGSVRPICRVGPTSGL